MAHVTMRELARRLGVSAVTVSKALSGQSGVSEETRARVVRLAGELGYVRPDAERAPAIQGLDVGIIIPEKFFAPDAYYAMLYKKLVQALAEAGHFGILELLTAEAEAELTPPNLLRTRHVDAVVLLGQPDAAYRRMIAWQGTPVIFLDFHDPEAGADAVVGDNVSGAARLTEHLIARGHREIGFVGDARATSSIQERYLGFVAAMTAHDLPVRREWVFPDRDAHGRFLPFRLPEKLPTALVCNCDTVAAWVVRHLLAQGVRVPEDVSVTGFDDFLAGSDARADGAALPALTTFRVDHDAMVRAAVRLIELRRDGSRHTFGRVVVGGEPVFRDSVMDIGTTTTERKET